MDRPDKSVRDSSGCYVVIPAFNEEKRIGALLDSLYKTRWPPEISQIKWIIVTGASTDHTLDVAREWLARHRDVTADVLVTASRNGKAGDLDVVHSQLLDQNENVSGIAVVIDGDVTVFPESIWNLLSPLLTEPSLSIVWGFDHIDRVHFGNWASSFQMLLANAIAGEERANRPRAYGRFFAYRVEDLRDFHWDASHITDDLQLAHYAEKSLLAVSSVTSARVEVTPAASYYDFYLQTYRSIVARRGIVGGSSERESRRKTLTVLVHQFARHPVLGAAFIVAHVISMWRHKLSPSAFSSHWESPTSTKF